MGIAARLLRDQGAFAGLAPDKGPAALILAAVLTTGNQADRRNDGIAVIDAAPPGP